MPEPLTTGAAVQVAEQLGKGALAGIGKKLAQGLGGLAQSTADRIAVNFRAGFGTYVETSYRKCKYFKTIVNPNEPLDITKNYVHATLTCSETTLSDDELIGNLNHLQSVVITGLAGSGKSMFMRYLTVWHTENIIDTIPLFVELRHLNNLTDKRLLAYIRGSCASKTEILSENQFELGLRAGVFCLILDGFDELNYDVRDDVQQQSFDIRKDFPKTTVVVSSRPGDRFAGWREFHTFRVNGLSKEQVVSLLEGLPYNADVKRRFIKEVNTRLFKSHRSFLSCPLLATIMLLTFEGFAEIPKKMHSFYSQAFDTLFQKHDAQKEQYQRQTHTGLALDEFKDCFAAFCALSYLKQRFSFPQDLLKETAERAIRYFEQKSLHGELDGDHRQAVLRGNSRQKV